MNYLVVACIQTTSGIISLRFSTRMGHGTEKPVLFVHCDHTAAPIELDAYPHLFKPVASGTPLFSENPGSGDRSINGQSCSLELALFPVASEMSTIGGEYGFHPRAPEHGMLQDEATNEETTTGSTFWFSLSYTEPEGKKPSAPISLTADDQKKGLSREIAIQFHKAVWGNRRLPHRPPEKKKLKRRILPLNRRNLGSRYRRLRDRILIRRLPESEELWSLKIPQSF